MAKRPRHLHAKFHPSFTAPLSSSASPMSIALEEGNLGRHTIYVVTFIHRLYVIFNAFFSNPRAKCIRMQIGFEDNKFNSHSYWVFFLVKSNFTVTILHDLGGLCASGDELRCVVGNGRYLKIGIVSIDFAKRAIEQKTHGFIRV